MAGRTARWPTPARVERRTPLQTLANFVTVFGLLGLFNGVCMFLLGLLTEMGVTTETTAKWSELNDADARYLGMHVSAETADTFGLQVLASLGRRTSSAGCCRRFPARKNGSRAQG